MARLLLGALAGEDFEAGLVDVLADVGADEPHVAVAQGTANAGASAMHARLPRSHRGSGGSAKGLIFLLVLAHLVIVAYWALMWVRQRRRQQRTDGRQRSTVSTPKAVGCTYDWTPTMPQKLPALPKIPNIQLIQLPKAALH